MYEVTDLKNYWEVKSNDFVKKQKTNCFSGRYQLHQQKFWKKGEEGYGIPVGKTAERGRKAQKYIDEQISLLIYFIRNMAEQSNCVQFKTLFERYSKVSSNLVGLLIRARRRNLIHFEGEMLLQRRDDNAIITLLD